MNLGGKAELGSIYEKMAVAAPEKVASNPSWMAKVRQTLNANETLFKSDQRGVWALA